MSLRARRISRQAGAPGRRGRLQVQRATLPVPLPVQPTAGECAALLKALIKHLLFQRAQIPYLYDELLKSYQEQQCAAQQEEAGAAAAPENGSGGRWPRRRRRLPRADKRLHKFLAKAEELMAAIDAALRTWGVPPRCFVLLGSSTAKPREAYEILMPPAAVGQEAAPASQLSQQPLSQQPQQHPAGAGAALTPAAPLARPRLSRQERLCLLAVRQLVVAGAELPEGTAHTVPCKLFVLLEGGAGSSSSGRGAGSGTGLAGVAQRQHQLAPSSSSAEAAAAAPAPTAPPGFAVKPLFKLGTRKGIHIKLLLGQHADQDEQHQRQEQWQSAATSTAAELSGESNSGASSQAAGASQMGGAAGCSTLHLSQLPDADAQPSMGEVDKAAAAGAGIDSTRPQHAEQGHTTAPAAGPAAAGAGQEQAPPGPLWYLCRTVVKGLNSHCQDDGSAQGFDGL